MNLSQRRARLRATIDSGLCIHPGSVYDPLSARAAEDLGFEAGMFAGSIASLTVLGAPDIIVLTLSEFAQQIHRICRAGELPLIVDADHGYGNAMNVKRTVEELETAGVSALTIEDTVLPRAFGASGMQLTTVQEGVGKMKAALAGRADSALFILGRTSAASLNGVDDAIARAKAYLDAGVDGVMFAGALSREDIEALGRALDAPIMLGGVPEGLQDREWLASCGVRIALQGHQPFMAAMKAAYDTLEALRDGTPPSQLPGQPSSDRVKQLTRDADYQAWMKSFLE
jgi:carboxyvinyl-carboxyphosphonate phosphorylmutase